MRNPNDRGRGHDRHWDRNADMGGSDWSGASGRGGRDDHSHDHDRHGRVWNRDADMGGSGWSGASGRGGITYHGFGPDGGLPGDERGRFTSNDFGSRHFDHHSHDPHGRGHGYGAPRGGGYPVAGRGAHGSDMGFNSPDHEERGPHWGKGPKGYKRSDERIREDVCEAIADQGHIDASDVEVTVKEGVVKLTGTVAQRHQKRSLEAIVERIRGVDDVENELRLSKPVTRRDENRVDQRLADERNGKTQPHASNAGKHARS